MKINAVIKNLVIFLFALFFILQQAQHKIEYDCAEDCDDKVYTWHLGGSSSE